MRVYLLAWKELFDRYVRIWSALWKERERLDAPERAELEREFLPAALELEESPVSPMPRFAMATISGFTAIALLWAILGKLDVVVVAAGKIVPGDRTKIIQPMETSIVKAIYVQDGQHVKAGDVLLELDVAGAEADSNRTQTDWMDSRLATARALALLNVIDHPNSKLSLRTSQTQRLLEAIPFSKINSEELVFVAQAEEFRSKLEKLDAEISMRQAELESNKELENKQKETLPLVRERAEEYRRLYEEGYVSKHDFLDHEKQRIELEHDWAFQTGRVAQLESSLLESKSLKSSTIAEMKRITRETLNEQEHRASLTNQDWVKASQRRRFLKLLAPTSGKVQQLVVHTVGGVVTPAQALLSIVPDSDSVEIEAYLQNRDVGFVREGQETVVKVEAFPYTKYGTVPGKVSVVSTDAINDEKKGLIYLARVAMLKKDLDVGQVKVPLTPGMAVSVEIKTGKRRAIEYFLSPLLEQTSESFGER